MIFSRIPHSTIFRSCGLVVDGTVDGKDNKEEKTREVAGSRMYRKNWNFLLLGFIELWIWWLVYESFYTFQHVWPHIKYSWWSPTQWTARRTWRRRPGRSLTLQYITSVEIFLNQNVTLCLTTLNKCNFVVNYTVDAKHNVEKKTRDSGRKSGYITSVVFFLFFLKQ